MRIVISMFYAQGFDIHGKGFYNTFTSKNMKKLFRITSTSRELSLAKNTVISPNFLMWKFCGKAKFPHGFEQIARNYAATVPFHKISTPGN